jgi:exoribonuclease-2
VTSPIRRFADLYNQWQIRDILEQNSAAAYSEKRQQALNEQLQLGRQADRELQQWLITQFVSEKIGESARGKIRIVTQQGFGVKILESGIEGFVLFAKDKEKTFDAKRMTLTVDERCFHIEDEVDIKIESVDMDKRRIAFSLSN